MNHRPARMLRALAALGFLFTFAHDARADLTEIPFVNPIEQAAARANQGVYNQLIAAGCQDQARVGSGNCTGITFQIFSRLRELVHTSNELEGGNGGSTEFSLGLDQEGLGFAMRWTAAEELAAQGSSITEFSSSQQHTLASRISALRFAARTGMGGGSAADGSGIAGRWSAFADASYGYGRKDDTSDPFLTEPVSGSEDAFDFDGQDFTLGVDYRMTPQMVIGVLVGHTTRAVDFDSSVSIVDANIDSDGLSLLGYLLWEGERAYVTGSLGAQSISHDMRRRITYPSLNVLVSPIDVTVHSSADSKVFLGSVTGGFNFPLGGFNIDPYLKLDYQALKIDGFREAGDSGFELRVGDQDVNSLDASLGLKMQYVFTPSFGVLVPYLRGALHKELQNDQRSISSTYAGLGNGGPINPADDFDLATDKRDDQFVIAAAGFSAVFKHGLQGFLQYQRVFGLDTFTDSAITGGVRYEF